MIEKSIYIPISAVKGTLECRWKSDDLFGNPLSNCFHKKFGFNIHNVNKFKIKGGCNRYDGDLNCKFNLFVVTHFQISGTKINEEQIENFDCEFYAIFEYYGFTSDRIVSNLFSNKFYNVEFYSPDDDYLRKVLQKDDFEPKPIKLLAHYTKMETVIEDILPEKKNRLLLKELCKTNDPVESKKSFNEFITIEEYQDLIGEYLNKKDKELLLKKDFERIVKSISFSKDTKKRKAYALPTMWAHYGQNHKGVCLIFDQTILEKLFRAKFRSKVKSGEINYGTLELPKLTKEVSQNSEIFFLKHAEELFFKKDTDWGSESEYRFVIVNPKKAKDDGKCYLENIDQALVAIVLGVDFNENYLPSVEELWRKLTNRDYGIYKLTFEDGELRLTPLRLVGFKN